MFESYGVSVMRAATATTAAEARQVAEDLGWPAVIKAQVKTGGRGKAGGVKLARDADEAQAGAEQILGMDIKGHTVHRVMVTEGADIAEEYYFSLLVDRSARQYLAMCSRSGGVDIETLAKDSPEQLAKVPVDPLVGIDDAKAAEITAAAGFDEADRPRLEAMFAEAVGGLPRRGRHAGRGEPPDQGGRRVDHRAGRQGHPRRERGLPPPRACDVPRRVRRRPARVPGP